MNYKYTHTTKYLRRRYDLTGYRLAVAFILAGFALMGLVQTGVLATKAITTVAAMPHTVCSDDTFTHCWQAK